MLRTLSKFHNTSLTSAPLQASKINNTVESFFTNFSLYATEDTKLLQIAVHCSPPLLKMIFWFHFHKLRYAHHRSSFASLIDYVESKKDNLENGFLKTRISLKFRKYVQQHYRTQIVIVGRDFDDRYQTTDNTNLKKPLAIPL